MTPINGRPTIAAPTTAVPSFEVRADHDLSVVIPTFNEEKRLPWTLRELRRSLDAWGLDYRVLVADDSSGDRTATLADACGPRFSTVVLDRHRGKGAAVRNAMLRAGGRVVAFTDADLPFELSALRDGYDQIQSGRCEVVFGARDLEGSIHHARRRFSRTVATLVFREVVKRMISRDVTDTQCGLKLFSLKAAREIFSRVTLEGFAFDAEVVSLVQRLGFEYRRIPVTLVREYASTLSLRHDTLPMLLDIARLWWRGVISRDRLPEPRWPQPAEAEDRDRKRVA
jgi:dolichyl-phosphate beta-glucosyltransferase